jgi:hypothetical protein
MIGINKQIEYYKANAVAIDKAVQQLSLIAKKSLAMKVNIAIDGLILRALNQYMEKKYERPAFRKGGFVGSSEYCIYSTPRGEYRFVAEANKISKFELYHMSQTISLFTRNSSDPIWIKAFGIYNNDKSNRRLGMDCRPCYAKVLTYFNSKSK